MFEPLKGTRILDLSTYLPGNYCTMLLGDLGAEVLKIEEPKIGDYTRWGDRAHTVESFIFVMTNRNKKSMKLNLKRAEGKIIFKELAAEFDVVVEGFRPGVMSRLGLDYDEILKVNPKIIYCSETAYGQTGTYRDRAAHDINCLGISGILACTGRHTGRPVLPGIPLGDMAGGGALPALAIVAAILQRERTGRGQHIDICQADVLTSFNLLNFAETLSVKRGDQPLPYATRGERNNYNIYETSDGKFIALGAIELRFWKQFCKAVGREDWFKDNLAAYRDGEKATEALKDLFSGKTQMEWIDIFDKIDCCVTPVLTPEETLKNEHLKARGIITSMEDPVRGKTVQIDFPARFSDNLNSFRSPPPSFGENTNEELIRLGYTSSQIEELERDEII